MGGTALGRLANRLTLEQHKALQAFCRAQLTPFFPAIYHARDLADKLTHGDLDILCEWDGYDPDMKIKGYEEDLGDAHLAGGSDIKDTSTAEDADNLRIRAWCAAICKALGGFGWARNGWKTPLISIGVHCKDLDIPGAADIKPTAEQKVLGKEVSLGTSSAQHGVYAHARRLSPFGKSISSWFHLLPVHSSCSRPRTVTHSLSSPSH